jgi:hypothetical protein
LVVGTSGPTESTFSCTWKLVPRGEHDLASAYQRTLLYNAFAGSDRPHLTAPSHEPPTGYGYELVPTHGCQDLWDEPVHTSPMEGCRCGIYALQNPTELPFIRQSRSTLDGYVFGVVKLWGKVIRGSRGARAQYAYPSRLYVPSSMLADGGLEAYGVPLVPLDSPRDVPPDDYPRAMAA